jgi:uncharacterized membrane protein
MADVNDDFSADTGRFQAFVQRQDDEQPAAWQMRTSWVRIVLLAGIVVVVAVVAAVIALGFAG